MGNGRSASVEATLGRRRFYPDDHVLELGIDGRSCGQKLAYVAPVHEDEMDGAGGGMFGRKGEHDAQEPNSAADISPEP